MRERADRIAWNGIHQEQPATVVFLAKVGAKKSMKHDWYGAY